MSRAARIGLAVLVACTERVQLGGGAPDGGALPGLLALRVDPPEVAITLADPLPRALAFRALGTFADGERDVTAEVAWTADNPWPGGITAPGAYVASGEAGGRVLVTARSGDLSATAVVDVTIVRTVEDPLFPPPPGAAELFDEAPLGDDPTRAPAVIYPADEVRFPPDVARMLFQLEPGAGNDVFRLAFDAPHLQLVVLTASPRWLPDDATWRWIARSDPGGVVTLAARAGSLATPEAVHAAAPVRLDVAAAPLAQAIYFWSAEAIWTARAEDTAAARFYAVPPDGTCVGCHALSRDGRRMAVGYGGETLQVVDVPARNVLVGAGRGHRMGWATFSPDGSLVLVADKGKLRLIDVASGDKIDDVPLGGALATHPDWSPDGEWIAVAIGSAVGNMDMKGGRIARIPYAGGAWGPPEILVPSGGDDDNNFFPRWSPDGRAIAYVHADGPSRGATTAELRLVRADGGAPIPLTRLAGGPGAGDHFPSWGPSMEAGRAWLAFASRRAYGALLAAGARDQIWMAAIDLDALDEGVDPSRPAFWLPAQDVGEWNDGPWLAPPPGADDP